MTDQLFAAFVDSRLAAGGWHLGQTRDDAIATAKVALDAALANVPQQFHGLHRVSSVQQVAASDAAWKLGGGNPASLPGRLHASDLVQPRDASRGTGGWDFTNVGGL